MSTVGRTWELWAYRYEDGELWHVGERSWVELHRLQNPELHQENPSIVPVLVEEILGNPYAPEVTHYGWRYAEGNQHRHSDTPTMIQISTGSDPSNPNSATMLLDLAFPGRIDDTIERGGGNIVPLRITERRTE